MVNESGQLNCFINAIIQIFWHTEALKQLIAKFSSLKKTVDCSYREQALVEEVRAIFAEAYSLNASMQQHSHPEFPIVDVHKLRFELFKYDYDGLNNYDLYKKADAGEFMKALLEMLHFCCNPSSTKQNVDSECLDLSSQRCFVHQTVYLDDYTEAVCQCDQFKV